MFIDSRKLFLGAFILTSSLGWMCLLADVPNTKGNVVHPLGHLEPLGSHVHPIPIEVKWHLPSPSDFFQQYIRKSLPIIFKGVAKPFPAFYKWDDDYLRKYGNWKVSVEDGKKEDRSRPVYEMSLGQFLDGYVQNDTYLVQDLIPPNPMTEEVPLPKSIRCGGFQKYIQTVVLWFSSGSTRSLFHGDGIDNLECMLDGWKEYILIDKVTSEDILQQREDNYDDLDVDRVDMYKYPELGQIPWYKMHVEPGDCYLIPYGWYHQVNSSNSRNMALSFWLTHLFRFVEDCNEPGELKTVLSQITQGSLKESSRVMLLDLFFGADTMTHDVFLKFYGPRNATEGLAIKKRPTADGVDRKQFLKSTETADNIFNQIDINKDRSLTVEEVYKTPIGLIEQLVGSMETDYNRYETMSSKLDGTKILQMKKFKYLRNEL